MEYAEYRCPNSGEYELLAKAQPDAQLIILEEMNHILKTSPIDRTANLATYSQPDLQLHQGLMEVLVDFIHNLK